jgi:hypothetical protein
MGHCVYDEGTLEGHHDRGAGTGGGGESAR